jgi:hypothetical protein
MWSLNQKNDSFLIFTFRTKDHNSHPGHGILPNLFKKLPYVSFPLFQSYVNSVATFTFTLPNVYVAQLKTFNPISHFFMKYCSFHHFYLF